MRSVASLSLSTLAGITISVALAPSLHAQSAILPEGMVIHLETRDAISSKTARRGDRVQLAVARPVTIGGTTLIQAGTPVEGEVTQASDNGLLGRSGKLDIRVSVIKVGAVDIPVRGEQRRKGSSGTLGSVGAGILFLPLAVIVRGKDVSLPAATPFDVYVDREITLDSSGVTASPEGPVPMSEAPAPSTIRTIDPNEAAEMTR